MIIILISKIMRNWGNLIQLTKFLNGCWLNFFSQNTFSNDCIEQSQQKWNFIYSVKQSRQSTLFAKKTIAKTYKVLSQSITITTGLMNILNFWNWFKNRWVQWTNCNIYVSCTYLCFILCLYHRILWLCYHYHSHGCWVHFCLLSSIYCWVLNVWYADVIHWISDCSVCCLHGYYISRLFHYFQQ